MKKAVLSHRIYLSVNRNLEDDITKKLTYTLPPKLRGGTSSLLRNYTRVRENLFSIPSGREDLIPEDYEIVDRRSYVPSTFPEFKCTLRESQQEIYDKVSDSCIINATPGWGKTFTALAIAAKLGQKTLIVTHTTILRDQWVEEIRNVFGIEPGIIGSGQKNLNSCIVVGNVQTLTKISTEISKEFGTVFLDECHHAPASTFENIINSSYARYKIGLSATLNRKDGKHVVLTDYFSNNVYTSSRENTMKPKVFIVKSNIEFPREGNSWAAKVSVLCQMPEYIGLIANIANTMANRGHKVLALADRVEFVKECSLLVPNRSVCITSKYITPPYTTRDEALNATEYDKDIVFGIKSIFAEGVSKNWLSCLVLATPINNDALLEQLIGRIERMRDGKKQPVVVDVQLKGPACKAQNLARLGFYMKMGYQIVYL